MVNHPLNQLRFHFLVQNDYAICGVKEEDEQDIFEYGSSHTLRPSKFNIQTNISEIIYNENTTKYQKLSDILKIILDYCDIDNNKYMIIASYCIRNYREINDLDMNMISDEWDKLNKLVNRGIGIIQTYNGQMRYFLDMTDEYKKVDPNAKDFSIEIFKKDLYEGFPNETFSIGYLQNHNGLDRDENKHLYFNKNTLLRWKKTMMREKDKADIKLLENLLRKRKKRKTKKCSDGKRRNKNSKM